MQRSLANSRVVQVDPPRTCCDETWEAAYLRFETPEQEIRKFTRRLRRVGAAGWPRDARIVELCCGRGNGLNALSRLGFTRLEGVDLSASLLAHYQGPARMYLCDCRKLPFDTASKDIVVVQGGLHHLGTLPDDLEQSLTEARRVLVPGGLFVAVEPWMTPFLALVHWFCMSRLARKLYSKLDCIATMNEHEYSTYSAWLNHPLLILTSLDARFEPVMRTISCGKLLFTGRARGAP